MLHLLQHCLDETARDLEAVSGTVLSGDRLRRMAAEHTLAMAKLQKYHADKSILGVRYQRVPSASPEHLAAVRVTAPRMGNAETSSDDVGAASSEEEFEEGHQGQEYDDQRQSHGERRQPESGRGSDVLETDGVAGRPSVWYRPPPSGSELPSRSRSGST